MIDILETGRDAIFVDSDVFFRRYIYFPVIHAVKCCTKERMLTTPVLDYSDPFEHMAPLGEYDWQIQDEAIEGNVNTGFFHIMPTESTISHWKGVLAMDLKQVSRDQHNTNALLGTEKIRPISEQMEGPAFLSQFESQNGISMNVIPTEVITS